nr:MAG TPA: hypothetical protein [Caudoviricetes sp.]
MYACFKKINSKINPDLLCICKVYKGYFFALLMAQAGSRRTVTTCRALPADGCCISAGEGQNGSL